MSLANEQFIIEPEAESHKIGNRLVFERRDEPNLTEELQNELDELNSRTGWDLSKAEFLGIKDRMRQNDTVINKRNPREALVLEEVAAEKAAGEDLPREVVRKEVEAPKDISRRRFLKWGLGLGATIATGAGVQEIIDFVSRYQSEKSQEMPKETRREKPAVLKKKEVEKENMKIENLADLYLDAYYHISFSEEKFPDKIFEKDLLIAQQCQESRGKIDAKSHSGALGVMQNMTGSIKDVTEYLNRLQRNTDFRWQGPAELDEEQLVEIKELIIQKSDYSRAFGKIYLMMLWDKDYGYKIGREEADRSDIKGAQTQLLGSYNAGLNRIRGKSREEWIRLRDSYAKLSDKTSQKKYRAYREAIGYVDRIFNYKERLGNIRSLIKREGVVFDGATDDYAAREIALKLDELASLRGEERIVALEQTTLGYLKKMKALNLSQGRGPTYEEIYNIVQAKL